MTCINSNVRVWLHCAHAVSNTQCGQAVQLLRHSSPDHTRRNVPGCPPLTTCPLYTEASGVSAVAVRHMSCRVKGSVWCSLACRPLLPVEDAEDLRLLARLDDAALGADWATSVSALVACAVRCPFLCGSSLGGFSVSASSATTCTVACSAPSRSAFSVGLRMAPVTFSGVCPGTILSTVPAA